LVTGLLINLKMIIYKDTKYASYSTKVLVQWTYQQINIKIKQDPGLYKNYSLLI
jgi:hypothetical protein